MATTQRGRSRSRSPVDNKSLMKNVNELSIGKPQVDADVTTYALSFGKEPVTFTVGGGISPFEISSMFESPRKTLTLRLPQIWEECLVEWETELVAYIAKHRAKYFGSDTSEKDVIDAYNSFTKKTGVYAMNMHVKINTAGFYAVRYWDADRQSIPPPDSHAQSKFNVRCVLRAIWVKKDQTWGVVVDGTDLQLLEQVTAECPF
jgi:hypothetical protein